MKKAQNWLSNQGYEINSLKHPQDVSKSISKINLFEIMQQYADHYHKEKINKLMNTVLVELHLDGIRCGQIMAREIVKDANMDYSFSEILELSLNTVNDFKTKIKQ